MIALLTSLLIFAYLALLGMATSEAVRFHCGLTRTWLIAPVIGLAVLTLLVTLFSQAGIPVRNFALSLTLGLLVVSAGVLWRRRPILAWRALGPFCAVLVFAVIYLGWQCFEYGFNWVGYGNADALAYSHSASRLIDHGFFDTPKLGELLGQDYTQAAWFQFAPGMYRCGFDVFLAWAAALTRMNPLAIYMPLMLCLSIVQVSAVSALVMTASRLRRHALLTAILLAMSPLFGFSMIAQLGPQMGGFALFLGLCSFTFRSGPAVDPGWGHAFKHAFVIAVLGVGLAIFYPEAAPFWALSFLAFHVVSKARGYSNLRFAARVATLAAVCGLVLGRYNLLRGYFSAIWAVYSSRTQISGRAIYTGFEVFKLPHGAAALFGLSHFQTLSSTPWLTIQILLGFLLLYLCVRGSLTDAIRLRPYAFIFLTMLLAGIALFSSPNAFGLFKLGLYIQPVLMAALSHVAVRFRRNLTIVFLAAYSLLSFSPYIRSVVGSTGALTGLSVSGVNLLPTSPELLLQADTPTSVPAQTLSLYLKGVRLEMLNGREPLEQVNWVGGNTKPLLGSLNPYPAQVAESERLTAEVLKTYQKQSCLGFAFLRTDLPHGKNDYVVLATTPLLSYFNGFQREHDRLQDFFVYRELADVKDHLVFLNSDKARDSYTFAAEPAFYPLESDPYRSGRSFYGMGRYFLFEVLHPSDTLRVKVSLTRTVVGDGRTRLPEGAVVLGKAEVPVGLIGAGAASVFSEPVRPVLHNGHYYLALDFRTEPISPPNRKTGLMRLFNTEIPVDVRKLIGYGRDISVISEENYQGLKRPRSLARWPEDLFDEPNAEFSGFYEDGWISDHAVIRLGPSRPGEQLVIKGMVPTVGEFARHGNVLQIRIDRALAATEQLHQGPFEVHVPILKELSITSVNLDFALRESLPKGDDRPVAAHIDVLAIR